MLLENNINLNKFRLTGKCFNNLLFYFWDFLKSFLCVLKFETN